MTYLILIYGAKSAWAGMPQSSLKEMYAAYMTYTEELAKAIFANQPPL